MGNETEEFERLYQEALKDYSDPFLTVVQGREVLSSRGSANKRVYVLRDADGAKTILKQFIISESERLKMEAELLLNTDYPNIPKAISYTEDGEWAYLLRDYVEGMNLEELIALRGPLTQAEVVDIGLQLCDTLTYLHSRTPQVIHRDIKPQNIIFTPDKRAMLIDFDIARTYDAAAQNDTVYFGTKNTAPPEQFGYGQTDARSDIYSLGVVLIYLSTGDYDIKNTRDMGASLRHICARCTDFAPEGRFQSAAALKKQLLRVKNDTFHKHVYSITAAALCLALVGAGFYWGRSLAASKQAAEAPVSTAEATPDITLDEPSQEAAAPVYAEPKLPELDPDGAVEFSSPLIEAFVREQLNIPSGTAVTNRDMLAITSLCMYGNDIYTDFQNEEYTSEGELVNGRKIDYCTEDIAPDIARMGNLTRLVLYHSMFSDASILQNMPYLEELSLKDTKVTDISPAANHKYLRFLSITNTYVSDISALATCESLDKLDMNSIPCKDWSALGGIDSFDFLDVSGAAPDAVLPYIKGKPLLELKLCYTDLSDPAYTGEIFKLDISDQLHLRKSELTTIEGIQALSGLCFVDIAENPELSDISPLLSLTELDGVYVDARFRGSDTAKALEQRGVQVQYN